MRDWLSVGCFIWPNRCRGNVQGIVITLRAYRGGRIFDTGSRRKESAQIEPARSSIVGLTRQCATRLEAAAYETALRMA